MKTTTLIVVTALGLGTNLLLAGWANGLEEPVYTVQEKRGDFELRRYEPYIVAETLVDGDAESAGNKAFRRLFAYISGENGSKEKISMTAPVGQQKAGTKWRVTFVMPPASAMGALPRPLDPEVILRGVPGGSVAALSYSGSWNRERYQEKERGLKDIIAERGLKQVGEPVWARYNSPFSLWFLRRNEVLIPVTDQQR